MTPARWEQALRQRTRGWDAAAVDHRRLLRQAHRGIRWRLARAWTVSLLAGALLFVAGAALSDPGTDENDDGTDDGETSTEEEEEVGPPDPPEPPEPAEVTLKIVPGGDGAGRITDDDGMLDCREACERTVEQGSTVVLTATPDPSTDLIEWGYNDCRAPGSCDVTVDEDLELRPRFEPRRTLTVVVEPGAGMIQVGGEEPACRSTCEYRFTHGTTLTLQALEMGDSAFRGWDLEACGGAMSCTLDVSSDMGVTALFDEPVELTVAIECSGFAPEDGCGAVRIDPGSLVCEAEECTYSRRRGSPLTLTAVPAERFLLEQWGGDCETSTVDEGGATGTCTLTTDTDRSVTATFYFRLG